MSHIFPAIVDEINYVNCLAGFIYISWLISVCFLYSAWGWSEEHQHVVFETAGVFPQKVQHIIVNICMCCLYVHAVEFVTVSFPYVYLPIWYQECCGSVYLWGIICICFFFCVSMLMVVWLEVYICIPTHFQLVLFLLVSPIPCASLSCLPCCLLNIQLNANRATICPSVVCSSPSKQNEQPKQ